MIQKGVSTPLPDWAAQQANMPMLPPPPTGMEPPDDSYLDSASTDPLWIQALEEARRRSKMAVYGTVAA
jgi:hypothetical protein